MEILLPDLARAFTVTAGNGALTRSIKAFQNL
jgi:hypothetical protein